MGKYSDISITWSGDITSTSGWGQYGRAILEPLIKEGASVRLEMLQPTRPEAVVSPWWEEHFKLLSKNEPGLMRINHGSLQNRTKCATGGPTVVLTHWETENIPCQWISSLNYFSEVWVTSPKLINKSTDILKNTIRSLQFPVDVDYLNLKKDQIELSDVSNETFVFGTIGQWNQRRNMTDLIVAYLSEFSDLDNVALVIKTFGNNYHNPNEKLKIKRLVEEIKRTVNNPKMPKIVLVQELFEYDTFLAFLRRVNVYCSASRGESKNISMAYAAGMGKQCVYVDSSANKGFTDLGSSLMYPTEYVLEPCTNMGNIYCSQDSWARPDVVKLGKNMRKSYNDNLKNLTNERKQLKNTVRQQWSPSVCAEQFANNFHASVNGSKYIVL